MPIRRVHLTGAAAFRPSGADRIHAFHHLWSPSRLFASARLCFLATFLGRLNQVISRLPLTPAKFCHQEDMASANARAAAFFGPAGAHHSLMRTALGLIETAPGAACRANRKILQKVNFLPGSSDTATKRVGAVVQRSVPYRWIFAARAPVRARQAPYRLNSCLFLRYMQCSMLSDSTDTRKEQVHGRAARPRRHAATAQDAAIDDAAILARALQSRGNLTIARRQDRIDAVLVKVIRSLRLQSSCPKNPGRPYAPVPNLARAPGPCDGLVHGRGLR